MKKLFSFFIVLMASASLYAQYIVSDKYNLWFEDSGHEVTTRKSVSCNENFQDLWNGCYVKINGSKVYIYEEGSSILYGDEINLLYNGYYRVKRSGTWYLFDPKGNSVDGVYGKQILYYPWGYVAVQRSAGYWDVYNCNGRKLDFYSDESPYIYWNGCWGIVHGKHIYVTDPDGKQKSGVYGDEVRLLDSGKWKCIRNGYVSYED